MPRSSRRIPTRRDAASAFEPVLAQMEDRVLGAEVPPTPVSFEGACEDQLTQIHPEVGAEPVDLDAALSQMLDLDLEQAPTLFPTAV